MIIANGLLLLLALWIELGVRETIQLIYLLILSCYQHISLNFGGLHTQSLLQHLLVRMIQIIKHRSMNSIEVLSIRNWVQTNNKNCVLKRFIQRAFIKLNHTSPKWRTRKENGCAVPCVGNFYLNLRIFHMGKWYTLHSCFIYHVACSLANSYYFIIITINKNNMMKTEKWTNRK